MEAGSQLSLESVVVSGELTVEGGGTIHVSGSVSIRGGVSCVSPAPAPFNVQVVDLSGEEIVSARIRPSDLVRSLYEAVELALSTSSFQLTLEGSTLKDTETAQDAGLAEGACVHAVRRVWMPLQLHDQGAWRVDPDAAPMLCMENGLAHLQGCLRSDHDQTDGEYVDLAMLPAELTPSQDRVFEVSKAGIWGNARLCVSADGRLRLKPAHSVWLTATWRVASHCHGAGVALGPAAGAGTELALTQWPAGTMHVDGPARHRGQGDRSSGYVQLAVLPEGLLSPAYRPALFQQSLSGAWGDARLRILDDGAVMLKPDYSTHACCTFYAGSEYSDLEIVEDVRQSVDAAQTNVGIAVADGLVHLQGKLAIVANGGRPGFVHVASLPVGMRPCRTLMFEQSRAGVWGTTRLNIRLDGTVWLRPLRSTWIAATWHPG